MNIEDWFLLGLTGLIFLQSKGLSRVFSDTTVPKASILWCSAFFIVQLSHPYTTTGKTIALTRWTFVSKVMSLLFNMLYRLVIAFLPRSNHLLISSKDTYLHTVYRPCSFIARYCKSLSFVTEHSSKSIFAGKGGKEDPSEREKGKMDRDSLDCSHIWSLGLLNRVSHIAFNPLRCCLYAWPYLNTAYMNRQQWSPPPYSFIPRYCNGLSFMAEHSSISIFAQKVDTKATSKAEKDRVIEIDQLLLQGYITLLCLVTGFLVLHFTQSEVTCMQVLICICI